MNFKELMKNEQSRKIVLLCIYLFMMFVLVLIVRINPGNNRMIDTYTPIDKITETDSIKAIEKLKYTNYQYQYTINYLDNIYNLNGTRYNNEEIFIYNTNKYFLKNNELYEIDDYKIILTNTDISLLQGIKSEAIYEFINSLNPTLELEVDSVIIKEYNIVDELETGNNIYIKTYEKDNYINKIELIYENKGLKIEINYSNIGKVSKLNTNFMEE